MVRVEAPDTMDTVGPLDAPPVVIVGVGAVDDEPPQANERLSTSAMVNKVSVLMLVARTRNAPRMRHYFTRRSAARGLPAYAKSPKTTRLESLLSSPVNAA